MSRGIQIKTPDEIRIMAEGGRKLGKIKRKLMEEVKEGISAQEIDDLATRLIRREGSEPSFKMVPKYDWSTCVNINEGIVHGIPKKLVVFKKGDLVSVDIGLYYKGFHTDTSDSVGIDLDDEKQKFLETGKMALNKAIDSLRVGNRIYDISEAIESVIKGGGYEPVRALVGHGVGRELHEEPQIPCFTDPRHKNSSPRIVEGMVMAIEILYSQGTGEVGVDEDGWTISSSDGKITGLFEDTIAVTKKSPLVLTKS